jgi:hypothetical protein
MGLWASISNFPGGDTEARELLPHAKIPLGQGESGNTQLPSYPSLPTHNLPNDPGSIQPQPPAYPVDTAQFYFTNY